MERELVDSDEELTAWRSRVADWVADTDKGLRAASPAYSIEFRDLSSMMSAVIIGSYSAQYTKSRLVLDRYLRNLAHIAGASR